MRDDKRGRHPNSKANLKPFQPGHQGYKPKGTRHQLDVSFIEALYADFKANGPAAIADCRQSNSAAYLKTIASILPKDVNVSVNASETFERLLRAISDGTASVTGDLGEGIPQQPGQSTAICH